MNESFFYSPNLYFSLSYLIIIVAYDVNNVLDLEEISSIHCISSSP